MQIKLSYTGYLDLGGFKSGERLELPDGAVVKDLFERFAIQPGHQRFIRVMINGESARSSHSLNDGDEVHFILPVGGG